MLNDLIGELSGIHSKNPKKKSRIIPSLFAAFKIHAGQNTEEDGGFADDPIVSICEKSAERIY